MKVHTLTAALGLAGIACSLPLASPARAEDSHSFLEHERKVLAKASEKLPLDDATRARADALLVRFDARRREGLGELAAALDALDRAYAAAPGDQERLAAALDALRAEGEELRTLRRTKREALEALLTDRQKLRIVAHVMKKRHPGKRRKVVRWIADNALGPFLSYVIGMEPASVTAIQGVLAERATLRDQLRDDGQALRADLLEVAADPGLDEGKARLAIARAKVFRQRVERTVREGLERMREVLSPGERARLVTRVYRGARSLLGLVDQFHYLEDLEAFR